MTNSMYFVQECPTCGRRLHIRVEYLGRKVVCQHCHGKLDACDPANAKAPSAASAQALLRRAEELLQGVSTNNDAARSPHPR